MMELPEIPISWLIAALLFGLVLLRALDIDSFTTAAMMAVVGFLTGKEQGKASERAGNCIDQV